MTGQTPQASFLATHQDIIVKEISVRPGWPPGSYQLRLMASWDHSRIPVIVAIPRKPTDSFSPAFAELPDGTMVSCNQSQSLARILAAAFDQPAPEDALAIAKLAALFGHFEANIGNLVDYIPGGIAQERLPRTDAEPQLLRSGDGYRVLFYSYDFDGERLSDCSVAFSDGNAVLASQVVDPS